MKTFLHSDQNLHILHTWNWIVYLITLRKTVRVWGRGCYVIITLWTCYENYFTATQTNMFMQLQTWNIIVYLITLRKAVRD